MEGDSPSLAYNHKVSTREMESLESLWSHVYYGVHINDRQRAVFDRNRAAWVLRSDTSRSCVPLCHVRPASKLGTVPRHVHVSARASWIHNFQSYSQCSFHLDPNALR